MSECIQKPLNGWIVFLMFFAFFGLIVAVNSVFITYALKTHSGVVTEKPYEKGLAHDTTLEKARSQPKWTSIIAFDNGVLRWDLKNEQSFPISSGDVTAFFMRPIKSGDDFSLSLDYKGNGIYETKPDFPHIGAWNVKLDIKWKNKHYRTSKTLIVK